MPEPRTAMQLVAKTDKFVVVDNVLPEKLWDDVLNSVTHEILNHGWITAEYSKLWKIDGPTPASSRSYLMSQGPFENYPCVLFDAFKVMIGVLGDFIKHASWKDIRLHSHIMHRGTRLNWHLDSHGLCAFTYYPHKEWSSAWGGELFIPAVPVQESKLKLRWDNFQEDKLLTLGIGTYLTPKPNRCIIVAPGVYHCVNRIDPDAGDHPRISIVGFLLSETQQQEQANLQMTKEVPAPQ